MKVYLSPSNRVNSGVAGYASENVRMQQLSNKVKTILESKGHSVYGNNNTLTVSQCISASNNAGVDCYVALYSLEGSGSGPRVLYYTGSNNGKHLAENIVTEIMSVSDCPSSRGVQASTAYPELSGTSAVAVIVEVLCHDSEDDVKWMLAQMDSIAQAIADGIDAY